MGDATTTIGGPTQMSKLSELTYADDPDKRFLRPTDYRNVEEEIKDLALTKEEEMYTLRNIIKVS